MCRRRQFIYDNRTVGINDRGNRNNMHNSCSNRKVAYKMKFVIWLIIVGIVSAIMGYWKGKGVL